MSLWLPNDLVNSLTIGGTKFTDYSQLEAPRLPKTHNWESEANP
jgi:hypothetical protein